MEIRAEKSIQQEQLTDNVYNEDDLGEYVEDDQVVSETTTADDTTCARKTMFETDGTSCPVFTLTSKISAKRNGILFTKFDDEFFKNSKLVRKNAIFIFMLSFNCSIPTIDCKY